MNEEIIYEVSDFVSVFNQTLEYAYPTVTIVGELANFRVSKNRWVYFDLKDEMSSVRFFGTVYNLPGPLEDGMLLQVRGVPKLHHQFGFSITTLSIQPVGEGSIQKAANLLLAKLEAEGLFAPEHKRGLPFPPHRIGLIASQESAAYADFVKIINARWGGLEILLHDVLVQGEQAPSAIVSALRHFNETADRPDVLVLIRGGGSAEDLAAFSTEQVTRAVAASKIPTLVAIGHEVDISLAELAADMRASTPSNAAELLVPDRREEQLKLQSLRSQLAHILHTLFAQKKDKLEHSSQLLAQLLRAQVLSRQQLLQSQRSLLEALSPRAVLARGYAIVRFSNGSLARKRKAVHPGDRLSVELQDGTVDVIAQASEVQ